MEESVIENAAQDLTQSAVNAYPTVYLMATNCCPAVQFLDICENAFYFQVPGKDGDLEEDICRRSFTETHLIRCHNNRFLILNANNEFQIKDLTTTQQSKHKFEFQMYKMDNNNEIRRGVMLYAHKDGRKMVVCCSQQNEVYPEAMDIPNQIEETTHKALFYLKKMKGSDKFMFESSMHQSRYLAFEPDKNNPVADKLVLHPKVEKVDEYCLMTFL